MVPITSMRIVSLTYARNEEDILEAFVRHHVGAIDLMFFILHRSTDDSKRILEQLQQEGMPVIFEESDDLGYMQNEAVTRLMHRVARDEQADWIVPLDSDEFLVGIGAEPRSVFASFPDDMLSIPWRTYVPMASDPDDRNMLKRITHRPASNPQETQKMCIPKKIATNEGMRIAMGNHCVIEGKSKVSSIPCPRLALAHFPVRTPSQVMHKVLLGWLSNNANPRRHPEDSFHWGTLFSEFIESGPPSSERLTELARCYGTTHTLNATIPLVRDPIPTEFVLRYTPSDERNPWLAFGENAITVARSLGELIVEHECAIAIHDKLQKDFEAAYLELEARRHSTECTLHDTANALRQKQAEMMAMRTTHSWRWTEALRQAESKIMPALLKKRMKA